MKKLLTIAALMAASVTVQADVLESTDVCVIQEAVETAYTVNEQRPAGQPMWSHPAWQAFSQARRDFGEFYNTTSYTDRFITLASARVAELTDVTANTVRLTSHDTLSRPVIISGIDFRVNTGATAEELGDALDANHAWLASNPCIAGSVDVRNEVQQINNALHAGIANRHALYNELMPIAQDNLDVPQLMIEAVNFLVRQAGARDPGH